jgi:hypothetical protein
LSFRKYKVHLLCSLVCLAMCTTPRFAQTIPGSWHGNLQDANGNRLAGAKIELRGIVARGARATQAITTQTDSAGVFVFPKLSPGKYSVLVIWQGRNLTATEPAVIRESEHFEAALEISAGGNQLTLHRRSAEGVQASGGEVLSSKEVSDLPLNKRDFSQLLLLAAGTMTDTNGAANFTQQFAVNGQRGSTTVFSMDGIDTTDPQMGGATFSNFNVDAIQEIQSSSGVMPAEIGHGASSLTNVITKSGTNRIHGTVFEFARNAAFDARNFFDRRTIAEPGRIPPFVRNEFGFTNGGPVLLPCLYDGRGRTFYFGQYQGFRQVLGTTQVLAVPTAEERQGLDTTAFPGDTLRVPVDPRIAPVLAGYPMPNDPQGAFGARTYAASSKVSTIADQFSVRIDHRISEQATFFARFNFDNIDGPLTNPSQTAIDPSFAVRFFDHQRNVGLTYARTVSTNFLSESSIGFIRSTPFFPTINRTQPAISFADGLYEPFNSAGGTMTGVFGNLFQGRQNFAYTHRSHTFKFGAEARFNHDTSIFGVGPNGQYTFGGGTAYSPVEITSVSGLHDIHVGSALPDALTGFLTATPYSYTTSVAAPLFAQGDHIGETALRRNAYNFYFQDAWRINPRFTMNYGLRYEVETPMHEALHRMSNAVIVGPDGQPARYWDPGVREKFLYDPQPPYSMDWRGWGPRLSLEWRATDRTVLRAGGAITTILTNPWQEDFLTGGIPFVFNPYLTALPDAPVAFEDAVTKFNLPPVDTPSGQPVFATGRSTDVPANTEIDIQRFQQDLAALTPGHQLQALSLFAMSTSFRNGYIESYTAGVEHDFGEVKLNASYVATEGVKMGSVVFPNSYGGADRAHAPFTQFDASGHITGGYGPEYFMANRSHSTYHSLQVAAEKTSAKAGLGFQASYTFSKSLDDTSAVLGGFFGSSGTVLQAFPQNPWNPGAEKGPSTFDITHVFTLSLIEALPLDRINFLHPLGRKLTSGWQLLNITTLTSGSPFTIFSGIQQTDVGAGNADRPDQIGRPLLSTSRKVREDYFGLGAGNGSLFSIPIGVPAGSGPNHGRFGTLGRDTIRGPAFQDFDFSLIKDTAFGRRGRSEAVDLQFRAEFFNAFNRVNFGLPSNIVLGSGFGLINRTAGPSRQVQLSLKLIY